MLMNGKYNYSFSITRKAIIKRQKGKYSPPKNCNIGCLKGIILMNS